MRGEAEELYRSLIPGRGRLFVVSGPSGVGKDAVLQALFRAEDRPSRLLRCVTATTRQPRVDEVPGRDYLFLERREFEERLAAGFFLEHALYNGNYYGTPHDYPEVERSNGNDVVLKIEVQGALQVRKRLPDSILIFIGPPSRRELEQRLRGRETDAGLDIERRLAIAEAEMAAMPEYDYLVINETIANAVAALQAIIIAERCRIVKEAE